MCTIYFQGWHKRKARTKWRLHFKVRYTTKIIILEKGKELHIPGVSSRTSTGPHHMLDPDVAVPVDAASNHPSKEHSPVVCCCPSNHILTAALSVMMKILKLLVQLFLSPDRESGLQSTLKPCSMPDRCMIQQETTVKCLKHTRRSDFRILSHWWYS